MNCQYCGREFNKGYNLRRLENDYCPARENGDADSDDEMTIRHTDEKMSSSSREDENSENDETDESDGEDEIDPWISLIDDAASGVRANYEELLQAFISKSQDESAAKKKAYEKILPVLQKK